MPRRAIVWLNTAYDAALRAAERLLHIPHLPSDERVTAWVQRGSVVRLSDVIDHLEQVQRELKFPRITHDAAHAQGFGTATFSKVTYYDSLTPQMRAMWTSLRPLLAADLMDLRAQHAGGALVSKEDIFAGLLKRVTTAAREATPPRGSRQWAAQNKLFLRRAGEALLAGPDGELLAGAVAAVRRARDMVHAIAAELLLYAQKQGCPPAEMLARLDEPFGREGFVFLHYLATAHLSALDSAPVFGFAGETRSWFRIFEGDDGKLHLGIRPLDIRAMGVATKRHLSIRNQGARLGCPALDTHVPRDGNLVSGIHGFALEAARLHVWPELLSPPHARTKSESTRIGLPRIAGA